MALYATGFDDFKECRELVESVLGDIAVKRLEEIVCLSKSLSM